MVSRLTPKQREYIKKAFIRLSKQIGNQNKLAASLGVCRQTISLIIHGKNLPGAHICLLIDLRYGIKKETLRPDIFMIN